MNLLEQLTDQFQSGETLATQLGVSRAAVWKAAQALEEGGYPLERSRGGYRWEPGTPHPRAVAAALRGRFGQSYHYLGEVGSTQDFIKNLVNPKITRGNPPLEPHVTENTTPLEGTVVLAERQTSGRGRRGRGWVSSRGLYFSVLLRPEGPLESLPFLSLAAGVAVQAACGLGGLKYPNDILAPDGRKMAGILLEAELRGEEARQVVLGIGLNTSAVGLPETAAALDEFRSVTNPVSRVELLAQILLQLEHWLAQPAPEIVQAWRKASVTLGQTVRIHLQNGTLEGTALDLDDTGALLLQTPTGITRVTTGDVELVGRI